MSKYYGGIGFAVTGETRPGVWTETITEKSYRGEVIRDYRRNDLSQQVNADLKLSNRISIIADKYCQENLGRIVYASYMGTKWRITDIEVEMPRIILTLGGVYNG